MVAGVVGGGFVGLVDRFLLLVLQGDVSAGVGGLRTKVITRVGRVSTSGKRLKLDCRPKLRQGLVTSAVLGSSQ